MARPTRILIALLFLLFSGLALGGPVNLNTADAQSLADMLNGVGPAKAEAIVAYRAEHGPFQSVADLSNVKGIGEKIIEKNKGRMTVREDGE